MMSRKEIRNELEKLEQQKPKNGIEFNAREIKIGNLLDLLRARIGSD